MPRSKRKLGETQDAMPRSKGKLDETQDAMPRSKHKLDETQDAMPRSKRKLDERQDDMPMVWCRCGDFGKVAQSKLTEQVASKLPASLVSLASFNGDEMMRACTGIFIKSLDANTISVLTTLALVTSYSDDGIRKLSDFTKIEVRLPNCQVVNGKLGTYDEYYALAIVNIENLHGFQAEYLCLDHGMPLEPSIEVLAAWRCHDTGEFMTTRGILNDIHEENQTCISSTCKIKMAGIGGPLIHYDGNFIGVNNYAKKVTEQLLATSKDSLCIPHHKVLESLGYCGMLNATERSTRYSTRNLFLLEVQAEFEDANKTAKSYGYPLADPDQACEGMYLNYSFEEEFGGDISSILSTSLALTVSESVVSLASFNGKTRFFVCTGVFVGSNEQSRILTSASLVRNSGDDVHEINHNMRIEVRLPDNRRVKGILVYCNLCYNIALVDIMGSCGPGRMKLQELPASSGTGVVAVGCFFYEHKLMATEGVLTDKNTVKCQLDCKEVSFSTCKITKAGIGGPLIDMHGNVVGMNFYHEECTPFLPSNLILDLLEDFLFEGICLNCAKDNVPIIGGKNRWPVTQPFWYYPPPPMMPFDDEETWSWRSFC